MTRLSRGHKAETQTRVAQRLLHALHGTLVPQEPKRIL